MKTKRRRGMILLLVLVVVTILAMICLGFAELMLGERRAAVAASRQSQARVLAQSGVQLVQQFLNRAPSDQTSAGGLYDNSSRFSGVLIADDDTPQNRGRVSVVAPRLDGTNTVIGIRYGLQDESTRINLAAILTIGKNGASSNGQQGANGAATTGAVQAGTTGAAQSSTTGAAQSSTADTSQSSTNASGLQSTDPATNTLLALPGMTADIADAILDWIDADDTPRANGAESEFYGSLTPPYAPRNAPPATIEELLLVRGVTPELLFGLDAAAMGLVPASSVAGGNIEGVDNSDGSMDHGWAAYLTLWSAELNATKPSDGTPKVNLNGSDLQQLHDDLVAAGLSEDQAMFIVAYRAYGASSATPASSATATAATNSASTQTINSSDIDITQLNANVKLTSILDLIGVTVSIPAERKIGAGKNNPDGQNVGQQGHPRHAQCPHPARAAARCEDFEVGVYARRRRHEQLSPHALRQYHGAIGLDSDRRADQHQSGVADRAVEHSGNDLRHRQPDHRQPGDGSHAGPVRSSVRGVAPH